MLWLAYAAPLYAATYYVKNSGSPACSDATGYGTLAAPFCTINFGISQLTSGSTLNVLAGIYTDYIDITGPAGTSGTPTVIQTYPSHTAADGVIIEGVSTAHGRVHACDNSSWINFVGFTVTNWNQGIFIDTCSHVLVQNVTVYNIGVEGIHAHLNSSFITIDHATVHDTGQLSTDGEGFYIGTGDSGAVDQTGNITVSNSTIYNTTSEGIEVKIGTHDVILEGNNISHTNTIVNGFGGAAISIDNSVGSTQHWDSNPNHIVRNNFIHDTGPGTGGMLTNSGIELSTGATVYNNVIWNVNTGAGGVCIFADDGFGTTAPYTRIVYHNTCDEPAGNSILKTGSGFTLDSQNNIGPPTAGNNLATSNAYYVSESGHDYHLAAGTAPISAGANLVSIVPVDVVGVSRLLHPLPDIGAYEYAVGSAPSPPTNLTAIVH
jgi:hypothetical protein